jgi:hypothetical protein
VVLYCLWYLQSWGKPDCWSLFRQGKSGKASRPKPATHADPTTADEYGGTGKAKRGNGGGVKSFWPAWYLET